MRPAARLINVHDYMLLLGDDEIYKELELSKSQIRKLESLHKRMLQSSEEARFSMIGRDPTKEEIENLHLIREYFQQELNNILLEFQFERLEQIAHRLLLRTKGLVSYFSKETKLVKSLDLKSEFETLASKAGFSETYCEDAFLEIIDFLDKDERQAIQAFREQFLPRIDDLDLFLAQLQIALNLEEEIGVNSISNFGSLIDNTPDISISVNGRQSILRRSYYLLPVISRCVNGQENLELTPETQVISKKLYDEYMTEREQRNNEWAAFNEEDHSYKEKVLNARSLAKKREERLEEFYDDFFETLTPAERAGFRSSIAKELHPRYGIIAVLLQGDLGRSIELSPKDKNEVRMRVERVIGNTEEKLKKLENDFLDLVINALSPEEKAEIEEKLGHPLIYIKPMRFDFR